MIINLFLEFVASCEKFSPNPLTMGSPDFLKLLILVLLTD